MDRGVELSMNLIIMIVIGLIVMVIVIMLVTNAARGGSDDMSGCRQRGGYCAQDCNPTETASSAFSRGCQEGDVCCIPRSALLGDEEY